jgi:dipeptidyl aminopeptidase/acylaminoacyl peptidase
MLATTSAHAAFPGGNGKIALTVSLPQSQGGRQIFSMNPDGSSLTNLTKTPGCCNSDPQWSADGTKIAFTRGDGQVAVMNADGTGLQILASDPPQGRDPAFSPDGTKIVFSSNRDNYAGQIYVMSSDGTGVTRLTNGGAFGEYDIVPRWSPDGTKIVFNRENCCLPHVVVMNADGTGQTDLTSVHTSPGQSPFESGPDWSPDGKKLVFSGIVQSLGYTSQVFTMNADGTGLRQLTQTQPGDNSYAVWSPDGTKIAFASNRDDPSKNGAYVMNADGTDVRRIDKLPAESRGAGPFSWQPIPNRPPDCTGIVASRPVLRTANHRLVPITLDGATDPDGDPVTLTVDGVTQDEPVVSSGDNTSPDAIDQGGGQLRVRAERNPHGDGRVYRIAFTASDGRGGSCSGTATVSVPRKMRQAAIDSAPPSYDSFGRWD